MAFSDIWQQVFGGSKTQSDATSKPIDMNPFAGLRDEFGSMLMSQARNPQEYGGPLYSPETANEQATRAGLMGSAAPNGQNREYLSSVLSGNYLPGQAGANPFLDAAIRAAQRPTMEGLTSTLERSLPGRFTQAGQFVQPRGSSAFDRAAGVATTGAANAMSDIATNMSFGGYEAERNRQGQASTQMMGLDQAEVDNGIKNLQAQALPRMIQELGIERSISLFQQKTSQILETLKLLGAVTAPVIGNVQSSHSEGSSTKGIIEGLFGGGGGGGGGGGAGGSMMGMGASMMGSMGGGSGAAAGGAAAGEGAGAGMAAMFASDDRIKRNKFLTGRIFAGVPEYVFVYADDPYRPYVGVMAQDVRALHPQDVMENKYGVLFVTEEWAPKQVAA